jgi:hypothetical protein
MINNKYKNNIKYNKLIILIKLSKIIYNFQVKLIKITLLSNYFKN